MIVNRTIMTIQIIASGSTLLDYQKKKWGLSFLIDNDVLFDTFCNGELLKESFEKYHIDPAQLNTIVVSHEHWDHTGGLWWILKQNKKVTVYGCNGFSEMFKQKVKQYGASFINVTKSAYIKNDIFVTGEIEGMYKNQPIYELSLIVKQMNTLAVVTGCSHPGILNILHHIKRKFNEEIVLLTGGLHLMNKDKEEIKAIVDTLHSKYNIIVIAPFHCTGKQAISYLKEQMGRGYRKISTGNCFQFNAETQLWEFRNRVD